MHVDFITPEQAAVAAEHGLGVNITPTLPWTISDMNVDSVGLEQVEREWPYRLIADAGLPLAASSDAPCTYPSWLQGVAVRRAAGESRRPAGSTAPTSV